jgi:hypothetical protein
MPSFFSRLKSKDGPTKLAKSKKNAPQGNIPEATPKPAWEDAWTRKVVEPDEVQELLKGCTLELKSRGAYNWWIGCFYHAQGHASGL